MTCDWCKQDGCTDHVATKVFPLGSPMIEVLGLRPPDDYVRRREALIPAAEELADETAGPCPPGHHRSRPVLAWEDRWSRAFHAAMDYLWRQNGA